MKLSILAIYIIINILKFKMKKILVCLLVLLNICFLTSAQTRFNKRIDNELDSTVVYLLHRISQHTAPHYKLYKTENMWTFLELETFSGRIWQVQYSVNDSESTRMKTYLNFRGLVESEEDTYAGRFELFPTQNIYNFILLDTQTGKTWQVQWSIDYKNRGILEIE